MTTPQTVKELGKAYHVDTQTDAAENTMLSVRGYSKMLQSQSTKPDYWSPQPN